MKKPTDTQKPAAKRLPQRTCLACRQVKQKRELVRIVRMADGSVAVDEKGKLPGRGCYLCRNRKCWEEGLKANRIEGVLRSGLSQTDRQKLEEYKEQL
ncbi:MAG: YlxR family protein [Dehalococcoidales bacterium]|nr:YlxR family protein [Dehalococcoidales bacterium]